MQYFHLEAKVISRGTGRSVVAAAAYASCSKLYNDYDGVTHDYTRKRGCVYSEVFLPEEAPKEWQDRQKLWEAVEQAEKTKNSRLARELIVALPVELSPETWKEMLRDFVKNQCTENGMCADVNIHDPDGHNPHAHILQTIRPLDEHGNWQAKTQKEYLCRRGKEERGFTAEEFQTAKMQGWGKLYPYRSGKKKAFLTPSEAEQIKEAVRTSRSPKSTRYGRQNPISAAWNSEEQLQTWRESWAEIINEAQEKAGLIDRVDCRSHQARGLSEQPTVHEGYRARQMEKLGIAADRCALNRQIRADNHLLRMLKAEIQKLTEKSTEKLAELLETLREHLILIQYQMLFNARQRKNLTDSKEAISELLEKVQRAENNLKKMKRERQKLIKEKDACKPFQLIQRGKLNVQIAKLSEDIEEKASEKREVLAMYGCQETDVKPLEQWLFDMGSAMEKLTEQAAKLEEQWDEKKQKFTEVEENMPQEEQEQIQTERGRLRA